MLICIYPTIQIDFLGKNKISFSQKRRFIVSHYYIQLHAYSSLVHSYALIKYQYYLNIL